VDLTTVAVDVGLLLTTAFLTGVLTLLGFLGKRALGNLDGKLDELSEKLDGFDTRLRAVELDQARETGRHLTDTGRRRERG
jgi:hypothetical protein